MCCIYLSPLGVFYKLLVVQAASLTVYVALKKIKAAISSTSTDNKTIFHKKSIIVLQRQNINLGERNLIEPVKKIEMKTVLATWTM